MKKFRVLATALAAAAFLAGCGGSDAGNQSPAVAFTQMVNFGDSLSDVGSYRTQIVGANGGGYYSINGATAESGLAYTNWTEFLASLLQVAQPCAAEVGLASVGQLSFLAQTPVMSATCLDYAQGGAKVTDPVGPGNAALFTVYGASSGQLGQLTVPVVTQVANYLSAHGSFNSSQIVTVLAGGNDLFIDRALTVDAQVGGILTAEAGGQLTQAQAQAQIVTVANQAIGQMTLAGTQLAALINTQIIGNGATHVVVVNIPDVSITPDNALWVVSTTGAATEAVHPHLTLDMTTAFNNALAAGLGVDTTAFPQSSTMANVAWVDAFHQNQDQTNHPAAYDLTNVTTPACKLTPTSLTDNTATGLTVPGAGFIPLASSLFCTENTLITDTANATTADPHGVMHYQYADTVHPTPYGYFLLARFVSEKMAIKGWL